MTHCWQFDWPDIIIAFPAASCICYTEDALPWFSKVIWLKDEGAQFDKFVTKVSAIEDTGFWLIFKCVLNIEAIMLQRFRSRSWQQELIWLVYWWLSWNTNSQSLGLLTLAAITNQILVQINPSITCKQNNFPKRLYCGWSLIQSKKMFGNLKIFLTISTRDNIFAELSTCKLSNSPRSSKWSQVMMSMTNDSWSQCHGLTWSAPLSLHITAMLNEMGFIKIVHGLSAPSSLPQVVVRNQS